MKHLLLAACIAALLVVGCGPNKQEKLQAETMDQYGMVVRWSQYDRLVDYIHPDWLAENTITQLDVERLHQFRVTEYRVRQVLYLDDGSGLDRMVQIRLNHLHTARERTIQHVEAWRWDEDRERWFLHSGLPDVTARR